MYGSFQVFQNIWNYYFTYLSILWITVIHKLNFHLHDFKYRLHKFKKDSSTMCDSECNITALRLPKYEIQISVLLPSEFQNMQQ